MCFPTDFLRDIVIPKINSNIRQSKTPVNMSEFVKWLGCIHFMSCFDGVEDRQDWWSTKDIDDYEGAPFQLNEHMSRARFEDIMQAIRYTDDEPPAFVDCFHEIRKMQNAWNDYMEEEYSPSWISCLDESMIEWLNKVSNFLKQFIFIHHLLFFYALPSSSSSTVLDGCVSLASRTPLGMSIIPLPTPMRVRQLCGEWNCKRGR